MILMLKEWVLHLFGCGIQQSLGLLFSKISEQINKAKAQKLEQSPTIQKYSQDEDKSLHGFVKENKVVQNN